MISFKNRLADKIIAKSHFGFVNDLTGFCVVKVTIC